MENLKDIFFEKIKDPNFIRKFNNTQTLIYTILLTENIKVLSGQIKELAAQFNLDTIDIFGFLCTIEPLIKLELDNTNEDTLINITLDWLEIYTFLHKNSYDHLINLYQWPEEYKKNAPLRVGYFRNEYIRKELNIPSPTQIIFQQTKELGDNIELFFFSPKDVNVKTKTIVGTFYEDGKYVQKTTIYPQVIDNEMYLSVAAAYKYISSDLETVGVLARPSLPYYSAYDKYNMYLMLKKEGTYQDILIESTQYKSFEDITNALEKYKDGIVLKPNTSSMGRGVIRITKEDEKYVLVEKDNKRYILEEEMRILADEFLKIEYIMQPYYVSRTLLGEPFDIRIWCKRGGEGEFIIKYYPRIGDAKTVVSNIGAGGRSMDIKVFLKNQFGKNADDIYKKIERLANDFPKYFQELHPLPLFTLGLDLGIVRTSTSDLNFYLFEVSLDVLGASMMPILDAKTSLGYYRYLYKNMEAKDYV